ncbi:hypothetical protein [Natrinema sp. CGMCC1.2065]|uniref:hypothetical protein n=1 Tax=Natrinema sp. CGMCC1.2065 TaxID=3445767 RepID=UPI003F4A3830
MSPESILFTYLLLINILFIASSLALFWRRKRIKERLEPNWLTSLRSWTAQVLAGQIARILGNRTSRNSRIVNWIRIYTMNSLIVLLSIILSMRITQLAYYPRPLPYSDIIQAIGSLLVAIGTIYLARTTFSSEYFPRIEDSKNKSRIRKEKELFEFIKGFIFVFWGSSILLVGYTVPLWEFLYPGFNSWIPLSEIHQIVILSVIFVFLSVGVVDTLVPAISMMSTVFGFLTFVIGIVTNWFALFVGLATLIISIISTSHVYKNMEFVTGSHEIRVEGVFDSTIQTDTHSDCEDSN